MHSSPQAKKPSVDNLAESGEGHIRSQVKKPIMPCEGRGAANQEAQSASGAREKCYASLAPGKAFRRQRLWTTASCN